MHVVVTGGAGFVGSHVAEYYAQRGKRVTVIDNLSRPSLLNRPETSSLDNSTYLASLPNLALLRQDIRDLDALLPVFSDADVVIHAAAQTAVTTSVTNPLEDFSVNALGTLNVLEAARQSAASPAVVVCSTNKVYGNRVNDLTIVEEETRYRFDNAFANGVPEDLGVDLCEHSPYGCSKLAADIYAQDYAHLYGMRVGVFRMSCIYGPRQFGLEDQGWMAWFVIASLLRHPLTIYGDGKQLRDVLYVTDLVRAFDAFVTSDLPNGVFNLGGGPENTLSLVELLDMIADITGVRTGVSFDDWRPGDQRLATGGPAGVCIRYTSGKPSLKLGTDNPAPRGCRVYDPMGLRARRDVGINLWLRIRFGPQ